MTLLAPWALWFAAVGGAVIALYVLKIKRRQQAVPALDFWRELAGRTKVHSLFERLKRLLSMLLWLLIAACLVLALGNPIFSLSRVKPRSIAIVIDNSASMQAVEEGGDASRTRLDLSRRAIDELTSRRPVADQWLLIEANREPRVLQPWTWDHKQVRQASESLTPFRGAGDLEAAVALADQLLAGKPEPTIVVISDGAAGALAALAAGDERIVPWRIGEAEDNLGIVKLAARQHRQQGNHHVLVSVVNDSPQPVETQLTLELDGISSSVELLELEPASRWEKTLVIDAPDGGVLRAVIERPDALMLDNDAYAVLEPIRPAVVWLVSPEDEAFFFEQALGSMDPLVMPEESVTMRVEQYDAIASGEMAAQDLAPADIVIFNNCSPGTMPARGRFVFVNRWPDALSAPIEGELAAPELFIAPQPHAITQYVTLQGARLARARHVNLTGRGTVLAHSAEGDPLIFLIDQPDRQSLCFAFDVLESDLPFRNSFPLLLRNAVATMHADADALLRRQYAVGETIRPLRSLPEDVTQVEVTTMRGGQISEATAPLDGGRFAWTGTEANSAIRVTIGDEAAYAAVNIGDERESHIAPPGDDAETDPAARLSLTGRLFGALPWVGLAAAALCLIAFEWISYNLRWTE